MSYALVYFHRGDMVVPVFIAGEKHGVPHMITAILSAVFSLSLIRYWESISGYIII